jgi:hypothetical protein
VPAGGWGLLGVQVEVEVVGKQDSLAAAVPRGIGICMRCSVWTGSGGSWGQEAKSNGSFFFANNQMGGLFFFATIKWEVKEANSILHCTNHTKRKL